MPVAKLLPRALSRRVGAMLLALASVAGAAPAKPSPADRAPFVTDTGDVFSGGAHQHGGDEGHLPGSSANVELIGELEPRTVRSDRARPDRGSRGLQGFRVPELVERGDVHQGRLLRGRHPRSPQPTEVAFIPARGQIPRRGRARHQRRQQDFTGDLLAVNNEKCVDTTPMAGSTSTTSRSAQSQDARPGGRRHRRRGADEGHAAGEHVPQRVHVEGRRQGLPRRHRQRGVPRRRHLGHHRPARAEAGRGVRPGGELPADHADGGASAAGGDLPARHGDQGDRRP